MKAESVLRRLGITPTDPWHRDHPLIGKFINCRDCHDEYEELKKTQPSYTDHYRILSFDDHYDEDNGILANVCRISDKGKFTLPLEDLEAVDRTSINYPKTQSNGTLEKIYYWHSYFLCRLYHHWFSDPASDN